MKYDGFKDLDKALRELPKSVAMSVLRSAIKRAGKPVQDAMEANAPKLSGDLAGSIEFKSALTSRQKRFSPKQKGEVELFIGPSYPKGAHGHLLEFGTSKMAAQPFARPAWDSNKQNVFETLKSEIWKSIDRARKRLAGKATKEG